MKKVAAAVVVMIISLTLFYISTGITEPETAGASSDRRLVGDFYDLVKADGSPHWAYDQMSEMIAMDIVSGYTVRKFDSGQGKSTQVQAARPDRKITRAEFATMMYEALDFTPERGVNIFKDDIPSWAETAVSTLFKKGIVRGNPDGTFNPDRNITRAEIAAMLVQAVENTKAAKSGRSFSDVPSWHWANKSIKEASAMGFINGYPDGRFGPGKGATRAEVMAMLYNFLNNEKSAVPNDVELLARSDEAVKAIESFINSDGSAGIESVIPYLAGEMEAYMSDSETGAVISSLKEKGVLGYSVVLPGKVVRKSSYRAEIIYDSVASFKTDSINTKLSFPIRYSLMKNGDGWYIYKEDYEIK